MPTKKSAKNAKPMKKAAPVKAAAPKAKKPTPKKERHVPVISVVKEEKMTTPPAPAIVVPEKKKVDLGMSGRFFYASGHRKTSTAKVRLYSGTGRIFINDQPMETYLSGKILTEELVSPLEMIGKRKAFDVSTHVLGGGHTGQAQAIRHGISKALLLFDPELRVTLKKAGFLTRDARVKERKKYGLHRARRAPQWAKR